MRKNKNKLSAMIMGSALVMSSGYSAAYSLVEEEGYNLNLDTTAFVGAFSSKETYSANPSSPKSPSWQEAHVKLGLSGAVLLDENQQIFGAANWVTSANWGDGDAAGMTLGSERNTDIEDLYIGYSGDMFSISVGRQVLKIGDGFVINDDGFGMGEGVDPGLKRAGAFYTAPHKAFDQTVKISVGGDQGFRTDLFWFKSDNKGQGRPTMAGANVEYIQDTGTFGLLYLKGLDTDPTGILGGAFDIPQRDGQTTTSIRYQGNAGVENLFLSSEFAFQKQGNDAPDANAWYAELGWTFADVAWSPTLKYRYSSFDPGYDQLFSGFNEQRGYGTWTQGEVRYFGATGGQFASDIDVHMLSAESLPRQDLVLGASFFDFADSNNGSGDNDAQEVDLYALWFASENLIVTPLLGFYKPDSDSSTQGNTNTNVYAQIQAIINF